MRRWAAWAGLTAGLAFGGVTVAADVSTPFIDQMKKEMPPSQNVEPSESNPQPFIDQLKGKIGPKKEEGSFIDKVKGENPGYFKKNPDGSYSDRIKAEIGPGEQGGAIAAVNEGRSELHARKLGEAHAAFGLQETFLINPNFTASNGAQPFSSVYPGFTPDFAVTYNYRLWRFWSGEIAFTAAAGATYNHGFGIYQYPLTNWNVNPTTSFGSTSQVGFQFISVPVQAGFNYRMTGTKYIQPYVAIEPALIPSIEVRSDTGDTHYTDSRSLVSTAGVWFQLDWISKGAEWSLYNDYGIQHYYLTVLYQNVVTLSGGVNFAFSGATLGFAFEY